MKQERHPSAAYNKIWQIVLKIPRGKVSTYGDIARRCKLAGRARQVGYALHSIPRGFDIPWQRVVNAQGRISLPKTNGRYDRQKNLLEREGIRFTDERIDLKKYRWSSTSAKASRRR